MERKRMSSGWHRVRDVHCKKCNHELGWIYEHAEKNGQLFKEGQIVLELAKLEEKTETNDKLAERWDFELKEVVPDEPQISNTEEAATLRRVVSLRMIARIRDDHAPHPNRNHELPYNIRIADF
uniref:Protein yippee-like n=1 Tax=Acrobeloides nanus TaxID=290746 RepID=A0A914DCL2_9BILA